MLSGGLTSASSGHSAPRSQHLQAVGILLKYGRGAGHVPSGFDPLKDVVGRPQGPAHAVRWLEPHDVLAFLRAADAEGFGPFARTLFYTGMRLAEVLGLVAGDVDLTANVIRLRENRHRRLKTKTSTRDVPIWPNLRPTMTALVTDKAPEALLFTTERGTMCSNVPRKAWARAAKTAGVTLSAHGARHSYISQRLQCLDGGQPVSPFTVIKEVGHADLKLIEVRYGHVAKRRVRVEGFAYVSTE